MSDQITLKVKGRSGAVSEIQVSELLEIDGKPYTQADHTAVLVEAINELLRRLSRIESVLCEGDE